MFHKNRNILLILLSSFTLSFAAGFCVPPIIELIGKSETPIANAIYNGLPSVIAILAAPGAKKIISSSGIRAASIAGSSLVLVSLLLFAISYQSPIGLFAIRFIASGGAIILAFSADILINQQVELTRNILQPLLPIISQIGTVFGTFLLDERFAGLRQIRLLYPFAPFLISAAVFFVFSTLAIALFWQKK
ncbi:hypothetical protein ACE1CD_00070 [Aerosakkonema sp. BLCC-F183]|uniref:hypothetical protein n=1 Tax=Aerosakkonema sp. BLCC-F183 TaxID=3342834 RepID=UPI0035B77E09